MKVKAIILTIAILVSSIAGFLLGKAHGEKTRMEMAEETAYEIQMALPGYEVEAVDINMLGPNVMITEDRSDGVSDMVARIEVGMGGELYPVYWDQEKGSHAYHWNESESVDQIKTKLRREAGI